MSEYSEDYQEIVGSFLNSRKEWEGIPQVVYFTIKAMFQHSENLQENIMRQQQLITEQSIKLRELNMEVDNFANGGFQYDLADESMIQQSGFKKSKRQGQKSHSKLDLSYRKHGVSESFSKNKSSVKAFDKEETLKAEEIKKIIDESFENKIIEIESQYKKFLSLEQSILRKFEQNNIKLAKQQKIRQEENLSFLQTKFRQIENQISIKLKAQRISMMKFAEESAIEIQKIWLEIKASHSHFNQFIQDHKLSYTNPTSINNHVSNKANQTLIHNSENKALETAFGVSQDLTEYKSKINKQMTQFVRVSDLEELIKKSEKETTDKLSKIKKGLSSLEKQIQQQKKQQLSKNESRAIIPTLKALQKEQKRKDKDKNSQESLKLIQQSLANIEDYFRDKLKSFKRQVTLHVQKQVEKLTVSQMEDLKQEMEFREKNLCEIVEKNCNNVIKMHDKMSISDSPLRKAVQKLSEQMILSRYLYFGQKQTKQMIQWEKNVYNSLEQNFLWKNGSSIVTINAAGLYRVECGLYPDNETTKIEAFIVLNGEPISSLSQKQVPKNSKALARGHIFNECLLVPGKSKICVRVEGLLFGQAYLQIHRL